MKATGNNLLLILVEEILDKGAAIIFNAEDHKDDPDLLSLCKVPNIVGGHNYNLYEYSDLVISCENLNYTLIEFAKLIEKHKNLKLNNHD